MTTGGRQLVRLVGACEVNTGNNLAELQQHKQCLSLPSFVVVFPLITTIIPGDSTMQQLLNVVLTSVLEI